MPTKGPNLSLTTAQRDRHYAETHFPEEERVSERFRHVPEVTQPPKWQERGRTAKQTEARAGEEAGWQCEPTSAGSKSRSPSRRPHGQGAVSRGKEGAGHPQRCLLMNGFCVARIFSPSGVACTPERQARGGHIPKPPRQQLYFQLPWLSRALPSLDPQGAQH